MSLHKIIEKIKEYDTIILHAHKRPDGDCLGCQFGLKDIIETTFPNKKVYATGENSNYVSFIGKTEEVSDELFENALCIVSDTATIDRCSDQRFLKASYIIKIDHHIQTDENKYGNLIWVDEDAPAASQMVAYLFYKFRHELKMTKKGATALFTGIVTDSGHFRYRGVDKTTFQLCGMLQEYGVDVEEVDKYLSKKEMPAIKLKGEILSNFITTKGGFVYYELKRKTIEKFGLTDENAAAQVNELASIDGYPVWALIIEYPNNEIRVRLRSNGPDIDKVANKFNGGGHAKAAGATLKSWSEVKDLIKEVENTIKAWREAK